MGIKITPVKGHSVYSTEVTEVVPNGQGDKAGLSSLLLLFNRIGVVVQISDEWWLILYMH